MTHRIGPDKNGKSGAHLLGRPDFDNPVILTRLPLMGARSW